MLKKVKKVWNWFKGLFGAVGDTCTVTTPVAFVATGAASPAHGAKVVVEKTVSVKARTVVGTHAKPLFVKLSAWTGKIKLVKLSAAIGKLAASAVALGTSILAGALLVGVGVGVWALHNMTKPNNPPSDPTWEVVETASGIEEAAENFGGLLAVA
jgi:hypothetical protein